MIIRKAKKEDCPRLLELVRELAEFEKAPEEVTIKIDQFEKSGFGEHPVWWAFVAEDTKSGRVVGFALYYIRFSTWKGERMYLEDIIVSNDWRGKGVGSKLFDSLLIEMKSNNFSGMTWQVLEWNEQAITFYSKYKAKLDSEWINCTIENN